MIPILHLKFHSNLPSCSGVVLIIKLDKKRPTDRQTDIYVDSYTSYSKLRGDTKNRKSYWLYQKHNVLHKTIIEHLNKNNSKTMFINLYLYLINFILHERRSNCHGSEMNENVHTTTQHWLCL